MTFPSEHRLSALARELLPGDGPCPFVVLEPPGFRIRLTHFSAGTGTTYVVVDRAPDITVGAKPVTVTIGYAPFVEGTTLIYDVTDETFQGKARPFTCDLSRSAQRVYAVVPVQIETIRIRLSAGKIDVAFLDACGERIAAALPFELTVHDAHNESLSSYASTDRNGQFVRALPAPLSSTPINITVRSLLTGRDESLDLRR